MFAGAVPAKPTFRKTAFTARFSEAHGAEEKQTEIHFAAARCRRAERRLRDVAAAARLRFCFYLISLTSHIGNLARL